MADSDLKAEDIIKQIKKAREFVSSSHCPTASRATICSRPSCVTRTSKWCKFAKRTKGSRSVAVSLRRVTVHS